MSGSYPKVIEILNRLISTSELREDDEATVTKLLFNDAQAGDHEAITLFPLFFLLSGNIEKCNEMTEYAGAKGIRDEWVAKQIENPWLGYLAVRLDALNSLETETNTLMDASMALQFHLIHKITDQSFYFAVKAAVFIYHELGAAAAFEHFKGLLISNKAKINNSNLTLISTSISSATSPFFMSRLIEDVGI